MPAGYRPFYSLQNASGYGVGFAADVGVSSETVAMEIFITGSATVIVEASADGVAWIDVSSGGYSASRTVDLNPAIPYYRARIGSYTSGYVSAIIGPGHKPDGTMVNIGPNPAGGYVVPEPPVGPPSVGNPTPDWFNVLDYGAIADGVTDNTAAYTAAFAAMPPTGGILYFPAGTFAGTVNCPSTPDNRSANFHVLGDGIGTTILLPPSANVEVIKKGDRTGVLEGATVGGFTVKAHASGSTGTAIDMAGFRGSKVFDIGYSSNAGGDYASLIHLSAAQMRCYANRISHVVIDGGTVGNTGPATVILFDRKDDLGAEPVFPGGMANECVLEDFFVFSNTGITTGVDALQSDGTTMQRCFWENNPGCTYVIPGNGATLINNDYEGGVTVDTIFFNTVFGSGAGNSVLSIGDQFSDMTQCTFHSTTDCRIINPENAVGVTWLNDGSARNNLIEMGGRILGVIPSHANNAAALLGGLLVGDRYYVTASDPRVLAVVS